MKRSKNLILEFSEFNLQRFNPDSAQSSIHVDDPSLSINAFDKHEDIVRNTFELITELVKFLPS
jgi:hypothetical protein